MSPTKTRGMKLFLTDRQSQPWFVNLISLEEQQYLSVTTVQPKRPMFYNAEKLNATNAANSFKCASIPSPGQILNNEIII